MAQAGRRRPRARPPSPSRCASPRLPLRLRARCCRKDRRRPPAPAAWRSDRRPRRSRAYGSARPRPCATDCAIPAPAACWR
ncbi:hypothetical protein COW53_00375 [bacterium CG17_big_fil_post_rev_8_21_14_2_50_64_8]|nr:MAG: hypothetical protein COW53_00375 [bacterium CG17_big_fil_post_rev_8_21_14_2_50_64_8]